MKNIPGLILVVCLSILLPIVNGCTKAGASALSPDKIPTAMSEAFKRASGDTKTLAVECAAACQTQDAATAFADLQRLSRNKDLSPEQRAVTAHAMAATFQKLRVASENGDAAAQVVLHQYISTR